MGESVWSVDRSTVRGQNEDLIRMCSSSWALSRQSLNFINSLSIFFFSDSRSLVATFSVIRLCLSCFRRRVASSFIAMNSRATNSSVEILARACSRASRWDLTFLPRSIACFACLSSNDLRAMAS